ncbi:MAG: hypothetical protein PHF97_06815 [Bacteroidales bacterium]|nr:hypothetical protein [Bacteroidales bacterium]
MDVFKKFLVIFSCLLITLPALQTEFQVVQSKPLNGAYRFTPAPFLTFKTWMNGEFQQQYLLHFHDSSGFKNEGVRLHNQLDFTIFRVPNPATVVIGNQDHLLTSEYITASLGYDHINKGAIDQRVYKLKKLQHFFWNKKKIFLLVIVAPDKVSFSPEDIPDRYLFRKPGLSGRDYLIEKCTASGIHLIDFNTWFRQMKDTSRFLLFPTTGVHWTLYGATLAADSTLKYLEKMLQEPMPEIKINTIELSEKPRQFDDDVNWMMNLICDIKHQPLAYPKFEITFHPNEKKQNALFVGDSFFWAWYDQGIIGKVFDNSEFWYYNKKIFNKGDARSISTATVDIKKAIERQNIIVLIQVGGGWGNPGAGFIDRAYDAYSSNENL